MARTVPMLWGPAGGRGGRGGTGAAPSPAPLALHDLGHAVPRASVSLDGSVWSFGGGHVGTWGCSGEPLGCSKPLKREGGGGGRGCPTLSPAPLLSAAQAGSWGSRLPPALAPSHRDILGGRTDGRLGQHRHVQAGSPTHVPPYCGGPQSCRVPPACPSTDKFLRPSAAAPPTPISSGLTPTPAGPDRGWGGDRTSAGGARPQPGDIQRDRNGGALPRSRAHPGLHQDAARGGPFGPNPGTRLPSRGPRAQTRGPSPRWGGSPKTLPGPPKPREPPQEPAAGSLGWSRAHPSGARRHRAGPEPGPSPGQSRAEPSRAPRAVPGSSLPPLPGAYLARRSQRESGGRGRGSACSRPGRAAGRGRGGGPLPRRPARPRRRC